MRFVPPLPEFAKETLTEMHKNHPKSRTRMRAHIILLSAEKITIKEIAKIYDIQRNTVGACFTRWETEGIVGLLDKPKSGRPRLLTPEEEDRGLELLEEDPRNSKRAQGLLQEETGKEISEWTFKRTLKRAGLRWKRMRRSHKNRQDPEKLAEGKKKSVNFSNKKS